SKAIARLAQEPSYDCQNPELSREITAYLSGQVVERAAEPETVQAESEVPEAPGIEPGLRAHPAPDHASSPQRTGDESIRVSLSRIDRLMNNMGELVILQTVHS